MAQVVHSAVDGGGDQNKARRQIRIGSADGKSPTGSLACMLGNCCDFRIGPFWFWRSAWGNCGGCSRHRGCEDGPLSCTTATQPPPRWRPANACALRVCRWARLRRPYTICLACSITRKKARGQMGHLPRSMMMMLKRRDDPEFSEAVCPLFCTSVASLWTKLANVCLWVYCHECSRLGAEPLRRKVV